MNNEYTNTSFISDEELYADLNRKLRDLEKEDYDFPPSSLCMIEQIPVKL